MFYEEFPDLNQAISIEKQLKNWKRAWKWALISTMNPDLKDLFDEMRLDEMLNLVTTFLVQNDVLLPLALS